MLQYRSAFLLAVISLVSIAACKSNHATSDVADEPTNSSIIDKKTALAVQILKRDVPNVNVAIDKGRVTRVAGPLATHAKPVDAVNSFLEKRLELLGLDGSQLSAQSPGAAAGSIDSAPKPTPVMYDPAKKKHKFLLYKYEQQSNGIPVFDGSVNVLVRNEEPYTVVRVSSSTRDLSNFVPILNGSPASIDAAKQHLADRKKLVLEPIKPKELGDRAKLENEPTVVIWAGTETEPRAPRLATTFVVSDIDVGGRRDKLRVVADLETGEILFKKSILEFANVTGTVKAFATTNENASNCSTPVLTPLPYVSVTGAPGDLSTITDANGNYALDFGSATSGTVTSVLRGRYFVVIDADATRNSSIIENVVPPQTYDFVHNRPETEFSLAQVNAYLHANRARDWVLSIEPNFPSISTETEFPIYVNGGGEGCPGDAVFDDGFYFCPAGTNTEVNRIFANSAFGSVLYHEFGHRMIKASPSAGQGAFGEGMGDTIAGLITDSPNIAVGLEEGQCSTPSRSLETNCQYSATQCSSCGSEAHMCSQVLSGSIWGIRNALRANYPDTYLQILSKLAIGSILAHQGSRIDEQVVIEYLTLDDDDSNIGNGTPHRAEICAGFEAHGLLCPALSKGLKVTPEGDFAATGVPGGPFFPARNSHLGDRPAQANSEASKNSREKF